MVTSLKLYRILPSYTSVHILYILKPPEILRLNAVRARLITVGWEVPEGVAGISGESQDHFHSLLLWGSIISQQKASWGSLRKDTVDSGENDRRERSFAHNIFAFSFIHIAILYIKLNSFVFPFLYFLILNCVQVQKGFGLVEGNSLPSKLHMVTRDTRKWKKVQSKWYLP